MLLSVGRSTQAAPLDPGSEAGMNFTLCLRGHRSRNTLLLRVVLDIPAVCSTVSVILKIHWSFLFPVWRFPFPKDVFYPLPPLACPEATTFGPTNPCHRISGIKIPGWKSSPG